MPLSQSDMAVLRMVVGMAKNLLCISGMRQDVMPPVPGAGANTSHGSCGVSNNGWHRLGKRGAQPRGQFVLLFTARRSRPVADVRQLPRSNDDVTRRPRPHRQSQGGGENPVSRTVGTCAISKINFQKRTANHLRNQISTDMPRGRASV